MAHRETFHPVIGPVLEAEALYVNQLRLRERLAGHVGEFVIWDVGLGAAANALTVLRATAEIPAAVRMVSFDCTPEPFANGQQTVDWELHLADFPTLLNQSAAEQLPKPHAILFDAFSPAKNPHMWTPQLFTRLFQLLDPARPCALPTYSRATMLRVTLLLAGFYVGVGHATGEKEETTLAANSLALLDEPLPRKWLDRAHVSYSAEPMWDAIYRQAPLTPESWAKLQAHPQFHTL